MFLLKRKTLLGAFAFCSCCIMKLKFLHAPSLCVCVCVRRWVMECTRKCLWCESVNRRAWSENNKVTFIRQFQTSTCKLVSLWIVCVCVCCGHCEPHWNDLLSTCELLNDLSVLQEASGPALPDRLWMCTRAVGWMFCTHTRACICTGAARQLLYVSCLCLCAELPVISATSSSLARTHMLHTHTQARCRHEGLAHIRHVSICYLAMLEKAKRC